MKLNGLHETFFIKTKIFSLYMDNRGQKPLCFRYISSILLESFNHFAGVFRKIFYCPPTIIGNFHCETSYFCKKMSLYNKGTFDDRFYKVVHENNIKKYSNMWEINSNFFKLCLLVECAYYATFWGNGVFCFIYLPISNKNTIFAPGIRNILSYDVKLWVVATAAIHIEKRRLITFCSWRVWT